MSHAEMALIDKTIANYKAVVVAQEGVINALKKQIEFLKREVNLLHKIDDLRDKDSNNLQRVLKTFDYIREG